MFSQAVPWMERCYPAGQIPRIHHGFFKAAHVVQIVDLNVVPQPSLYTITDIVTTLPALGREDIRRRCSKVYFSSEALAGDRREKCSGCKIRTHDRGFNDHET